MHYKYSCCYKPSIFFFFLVLPSCDVGSYIFFLYFAVTIREPTEVPTYQVCACENALFEAKILKCLQKISQSGSSSNIIINNSDHTAKTLKFNFKSKPSEKAAYCLMLWYVIEEQRNSGDWHWNREKYLALPENSHFLWRSAQNATVTNNILR